MFTTSSSSSSLASSSNHCASQQTCALHGGKKGCCCWPPDGDCVSLLFHTTRPSLPPPPPPSLPVSQHRRPSQMLHGGAGVRHSTPYAPNASQLLHAWTTTTITTAVASWINSLADRQSISPCLRGEPVFVFVKLLRVKAINRKEDWGHKKKKNITECRFFFLSISSLKLKSWE